MVKKDKLPPVHPGDVLREDYLIPAGVTVNALAIALRVPVSRLYEIVNCKRAVTPETALRLSRYLGTRNSGWVCRAITTWRRPRRNSQSESKREVLQPREHAA